MNNQEQTKNKTSSTLALLTMAAMFLGVLCFFLPLVTVNFFGSHSFTAMDVVVGDVSDDTARTCLTICLAASVFGGVFAGLGYKSAKMLVVSLILSLANCALMAATMAEAMDYAAIGFHLFEILNVAALIMSIIGVSISGQQRTTTILLQPDKKSISCATCGAQMEADAVFCSKCGTSVAKKVVRSMIVCPTCYAEQDSDAVVCSICGQPMRQKKESGKNKGDRNAICPHCGARQSSENTHCKYCNTPMR